MKSAGRAIIAVVVLMVAVQAAFAQGIQSSIVNLTLNGNWKQAADIEKEGIAPGVQVFYDQTTGTVVQLRNDYQIRAVGEIAQQFKTAGSSGATPDAAKILMMTMFPLPSKYAQAISGSIHDGHVAKLWDVKDPGNAQWFYVSQLFNGYRVTGGSSNSELREEYFPLRVTRAEHKAVGRGDALLFEAETDRPAPEAAIKRFKLPASIKDQKLRYGWIQYSPGGITSSESIISLAFATPVNSGIDINTVLAEMLKGDVPKAQAQN